MVYSARSSDDIGLFFDCRQRRVMFAVLGFVMLVMLGPLAKAEGKVVQLGTDADVDDVLRAFTGQSSASFRSIRIHGEPKPIDCGSSENAVAIAIQFDLNSSELKPAAQATLAAVADAMADPQLQPCGFLVEGHTDSSGNEHYNFELSTKRAEAVRDFLGSLGIVEQRLDVIGKGEIDPLNLEEPAAPENRRVQFRVISSR